MGTVRRRIIPFAYFCWLICNSILISLSRSRPNLQELAAASVLGLSVMTACVLFLAVVGRLEPRRATAQIVGLVVLSSISGLIAGALLISTQHEDIPVYGVAVMHCILGVGGAVGTLRSPSGGSAIHSPNNERDRESKGRLTTG